MSVKAFLWCIHELRHKAKFAEETGLIKALDSQTSSVKSDTVINAELRRRLINALKPLQQSTDKDWHPNSDRKVLNLVGREDCLDSCGKGELLHEQSNFTNDHGVTWWSRKFQWLPSDVKFKADSGLEVHFTSYINNPQPVKHTHAYKVIESFTSKAVPMWNECLVMEPDSGRPSRIPIPNKAEFAPTQALELPGTVDYSTPVKQLDEATLQKLLEYIALPDRH